MFWLEILQRAKAARDARIAEKEFEAIFMREMPIAPRSTSPEPIPQVQPQPQSHAEARPDVPQWEPIDDQRSRPVHRRNSSLASQSSAITAVASPPVWVELKPPRPRPRPPSASQPTNGIVPMPSRVEQQQPGDDRVITPRSSHTS